MMHYLRRQAFEPLCTRGGDYYACASTQFVGCCATNPCVAGGSCGSNSLKPMSFDRDSYSNAFKDQACSTGAWYTCIGTTPPFVGCCRSNPCTTTSGCPDGDLDEGYLSSNPYDAMQWLSVAKLDSGTTTSLAAQESSSSAETASSGSATTTSLAAQESSSCAETASAGSATATSLAAQKSSSSSETASSGSATATSLRAQESSSSAETASYGPKLSGGAISGVTVGAIAFMILIIGLFFLRRKIAPPTQSNKAERPSRGKNKAPSGGNAPSGVHVREGSGTEVAPREVRSSEMTNLPPPSPSSAYSPIAENPYSPHRKNRISELEQPASNLQTRQQIDPNQPLGIL